MDEMLANKAPSQALPTSGAMERMYQKSRNRKKKSMS